MKRLIIDENEFKRLYLEEMLSQEDLANHFHCSRNAIQCRIKELNITRDRTTMTRQNRQQVGIRSYKGLDYPRGAWRFRFMFPTDACGWIRCPDPRAESLNWGVDHNHSCTLHDTSKLACRHCVRAYVHQSCNLIIGNWDWAQREGLPIPDDVAAFLSIGN